MWCCPLTADFVSTGLRPPRLFYHNMHTSFYHHFYYYGCCYYYLYYYYYCCLQLTTTTVRYYGSYYGYYYYYYHYYYYNYRRRHYKTYALYYCCCTATAAAATVGPDDFCCRDNVYYAALLRLIAVCLLRRPAGSPGFRRSVATPARWPARRIPFVRSSVHDGAVLRREPSGRAETPPHSYLPSDLDGRRRSVCVARRDRPTGRRKTETGGGGGAGYATRNHPKILSYDLYWLGPGFGVEINHPKSNVLKIEIDEKNSEQVEQISKNKQFV